MPLSWSRSFLVVLSLVCLCSVPSFAENTAVLRDEGLNRAEQESFSYVIGPGNLIQIKIFGEASTNQIYRVDEAGNVNHSLIGRIKLGGLTVSVAEELMEKKLSGDYIINPRINIFILEYSHFSIMGEVQKPGTYEITGRVSAIEAISMAGGFTRVANPRTVKIIRKTEDGSESNIPVDTTIVTEKGKRSDEVYVEADDVIMVPKSFF